MHSDVLSSCWWRNLLWRCNTGMFLYSCKPAAVKIILGLNHLRKPLVPLDSSNKCFCSMYCRGTLKYLVEASMSAHKNIRGKHKIRSHALSPNKIYTLHICGSLNKKKQQLGVTRNRQISKEISLAVNIPRTKAPSAPEHNTETIRICVGWKSQEFEAFNLFEKQFLALGQKGPSCGLNARILYKQLITNTV